MFGGGSHYAKRLNGNIRTTAVLPAVDTWAGGGPAGPAGAGGAAGLEEN